MTPAEATQLARSYETMSLENLRAEWRARYGAPPTLRSTDLLRRMLAWRVQADCMGGLDRKLVNQIIKAGKAKGPRKPIVAKGVRLVREWQGRVYEAEACEGGFRFDGEVHASLSAIARKITGTRWNGPLFFGLRDEAG